MTQGNRVTDEAARVRLGATTCTRPEILQRLATDPSVTVRATLALNPAAPAETNHVLAHDPDERVRALLARKLAALVPSLAAPAQAELQQKAYATLIALVNDEAERVRGAIAEVIKHMPEAPRALVLRLACDAAVMVSEPVIRFSPLLTTEDLLALIAAAPNPATVVAVAGRAGITGPVSDAIAASANSQAIHALLLNPSAQIREATLDALVAGAAEHTEWQEPLVHRPQLPPRAARALSEIVATHLLQALAGRSDLEPELAEALREKLTHRLHAPPSDAQRPPDPVAQARELGACGKLVEATVLAAARRGDGPLLGAMLSVAAGVPLSVVERATSLRSAKGLVSLAWRAGFSMQVAVAAQTVLGRLAPGAILPAGLGGGFPLAVEEMRWQLDFLCRTGR